MRLARALAGGALAATLLLVSSDALLSQEKKDSRVKGQLPPGWSKLDLTASQREEVYKLQSEYRAKIDKLRDEIRQLEAELARKRVAVLTDEQKKKLVESVAGGEPGKEKTKSKVDKDKGKATDPDK